MSKFKTLAAVVGLLTAGAASAVTAGNLDSQPPLRLGSFSVTPHQLAVTRTVSYRVEQELATPYDQNAAVPPEDRMNASIFGDFPATKHQASLGLAHPPPATE